MLEIEKRSTVDKDHKMKFANESDKKHYLDKQKEFNVEKKLLAKSKRLEKRWLLKKKYITRLVDELKASHKAFSKNVRVEAFEKPGPRILNIKRHSQNASVKGMTNLRQ